jgi:hypothetical protein
MTRKAFSLGVAFVLIALFWLFFTGLRRPTEAIRAGLVEITPLGSSPDFVMGVVKQKGWRSAGYEAGSGFLKQEPLRKMNVVGVSSIAANLGDYRSSPLLTTNVSAYWGFDKDRHLIDVWVWKTTDAP